MPFVFTGFNLLPQYLFPGPGHWQITTA